MRMRLEKWVRIPPSPPYPLGFQGLQGDFRFQSINLSIMLTLSLRPGDHAAVRTNIYASFRQDGGGPWGFFALFVPKGPFLEPIRAGGRQAWRSAKTIAHENSHQEALAECRKGPVVLAPSAALKGTLAETFMVNSAVRAGW